MGRGEITISMGRSNEWHLLSIHFTSQPHPNPKKPTTSQSLQHKLAGVTSFAGFLRFPDLPCLSLSLFPSFLCLDLTRRSVIPSIALVRRDPFLGFFGSWDQMVLQLFFTVAFSAVPLTLYVPPIRSLNLFVETMEDLMRESRTYTHRVYPRVRHVWVRMVDCLLCSTA